MEKRKSVIQKVIERFERVRAYLVARPALFAAQGTVVATSRTYRGRQLGPYFQLAWREEGRQRRLYLGRSLELVDRVRNLLDQLQQPLRQRRLFARLKRQARAALCRWMADLRPFLGRWGIDLKGFELRGTRRALRSYAQTFPPHELAPLARTANGKALGPALQIDSHPNLSPTRRSTQRSGSANKWNQAGSARRGTRSACVFQSAKQVPKT
jgi:hypothetical protein